MLGWSNKVFAISGGINLLSVEPQVPDTIGFVGLGAPSGGPIEFGFPVFLRFWLWDRLQMTLIWLPLNINIGSINIGSPFNVMLFAGYRLPFQRWSFFIEGGGGNSLFGTIHNNNLMHEFQNPVFGAALGADFLIFPFLSTGITNRYILYYDKPTPLLDINLAISISFVFSR